MPGTMSPAPQDWSAGAAAVSETHVSVLFAVGDRVYKLKKPVSPGFLDFSTPELRRAACEREVELNRRFAPDVYLGVVDVTGFEGRPCDHLVVMRRMPADRRLAARVRAGLDVDADLHDVARRVAAFHAAAPSNAEITAAASPEAIRALWNSGFKEIRPFAGDVLDPAACDRVEEVVHRYIDGREPLFRQRMAAGRIRDGHGDLQAEDIFCLDDGPRILDCIEFNDRFRYGDVLADVAFLAMDLERLGAAGAGERFLALYREFSGESYPASLASHYVAYRGHVRAKVTCLRHTQGDPGAAGAARDLFALTLRHLERARVRLVLVGGLPGTGKSTLAAGLADRLHWPVLRSDEIRKDLAGLAHDEPAGAGFREGLYRPEMTDAVYRELLDRARRALELGESVILDASWSDRRWREAAAGVAQRTSSDLVELRCELPPAEAVARMAKRRAAGGDASDATPEVAAAMAAVADRWPSAVAVDTSGSAGAALERAVAAVVGSPGAAHPDAR